MPTRLAALLLMTLASALADGAPKTPFGSAITPADTKTWHCESGRTVVSFLQGNELLRIFYRGRQYALRPVASKLDYSGLVKYANIRLNAEKTLVSGYEWVENVRQRNRMELFFVQQEAPGQRQQTRLEVCTLARR